MPHTGRQFPKVAQHGTAQNTTEHHTKGQPAASAAAVLLMATSSVTPAPETPAAPATAARIHNVSAVKLQSEQH